jgi:glycosyltransferase involved in cell wall biosynthesis
MAHRILQVLDSVEEEASGPSYSVPKLCEALGHRGNRVLLMTVGPAALETLGWEHQAYPLDYPGTLLLPRLRLSRGLVAALNEATPHMDVVHAHGLWRLANIYAARAAARARKPFVLSPRGMLGGAALRFSASQKRVFWILGQARAARSAHCIHATSEQEYSDVRAMGLKAPIAIVPNGIDIRPQLPRNRTGGDLRTVLFLGRLHPKKGLGDLIEAWGRLAGRHPSWRLEVVGPIDSAYAVRLREQAAEMPRVRLVGPLYAEEKTRAYREADLFVLPTQNENFGMTVAEALAQGTPVICSKGAPWEGLSTHGCGWWIDQGVDALAAGLDAAMRLDRGRLEEMGQAGRRWMSREFDWDGIGATMANVYAWLRGQGPRPDCVLD